VQQTSALLAKLWPWLRRLLQLVFVLLPLILTWDLVDDNRTNTLFLDDWSYVPLYEKAKLGAVTMHDLFGGYLEHRPAVVRIINIALVLLSGGDVGLQCVASFVAVALTWLNCGWLLRRALGGWDRLWIPWGLMGWVMFCPVQWQGFLWPACMLVNLPLLFFTTALLLMGHEKFPLWIRFLGAAFLAWLATYSYTPGLILWVLIPAAVACGYGVNAEDRRRFLLAWLLPMGVVIFCYFHGLENEVEPVFAYGQGKGDTATHSIATVLRSPDKGVKFALTLLGANFSRGVFGPRRELALWLGAAMLALFLTTAWAWLSRWRQLHMRKNAVPFLLISVFGLAIAAMVAAGRAWASHDVGGALNNRYACYACAFTAGVVGMFAMLREGNMELGPQENSVTRQRLQKVNAWLMRPAAGLLCGLLVANWFYGAEMMRSWHYARLRGAVDLHFTPLLGQQQDRGRAGVQVRLAAERAATLNRLGLLDRPQAHTLDLDQFKSKGKLDPKLGRITGTDRRPAEIDVAGYALLTMGGRPPDGILLTVRSEVSPKRKIVDVCLTDNLPGFLLLNTSKDNQFIFFDDYRPRRCGQWAATVKRGNMPPGKVRIEAWALNFEQFTVLEIGDGITVDN
jgi:hypothetical protein